MILHSIHATILNFQKKFKMLLDQETLDMPENIWKHLKLNENKILNNNYSNIYVIKIWNI
jgi:hypothetical protein